MRYLRGGPTEGAAVGVGPTRVTVPGKCRRADLGADMLANLFAWLLNIVVVALAAALLLSIGGW